MVFGPIQKACEASYKLRKRPLKKSLLKKKKTVYWGVAKCQTYIHSQYSFKKTYNKFYDNSIMLQRGIQ